MTTTEIKKLATFLAVKHGLDNWEIYIGDEFFDTVGSCNKRQRAIWLNEFFFSRCNDRFCKDTILHEIAHALVPNYVAHGREWKEKCVEIGAIPHEVWEGRHKDFEKEFGKIEKMKLPEAPDKTVIRPLDKSKIIKIQVNYLVQEM